MPAPAPARVPDAALVERPAMTVRRKNHAILIQISGALREVDGDSAGQRHIALAGLQCATRDFNGDQRSRARGLHIHARSVQVQLVGNPRTQKVLVVTEHQLVAAHRLHQRGVAHDLGE